MTVSGNSVTNRLESLALTGAFLLLAAGGVYYSKLQGWALITEVAIVLAVLLVYAIVYDRVVIR